jgi:hypothetical protein
MQVIFDAMVCIGHRREGERFNSTAHQRGNLLRVQDITSNFPATLQQDKEFFIGVPS